MLILLQNKHLWRHQVDDHIICVSTPLSSALKETFHFQQNNKFKPWAKCFQLGKSLAVSKMGRQTVL